MFLNLNESRQEVFTVSEDILRIPIRTWTWNFYLNQDVESFHNPYISDPDPARPKTQLKRKEALKYNV